MPLSVTSPHVLQVGGTAYDLRHVVSVSDTGNSYVRVTFGLAARQLTEIFQKVAFEAAYQDSLDAAGTGGGGGGGSPTGTAGGDLYQSYPTPRVVQVTPRSKTLTYDGAGRLSTLTDSLGGKTFNYDGSGKLTSIVGTGRYAGTKTFGYDGGGALATVTVS